MKMWFTMVLRLLSCYRSRNRLQEREQGGNMKRILVTYASRYGATAEIALEIADRLCLRNFEVDLRTVEEAGVLSGYDGVVVGSSIRMGHWLAPAADFVTQHRDALRSQPLALFTVHFLATDDSEASRQQRAAYVAPLHQVVEPQYEAFFAGKFDPAKFSIGDRLIALVVRPEAGEKRDWAAIDRWADQLFTTPISVPAVTGEVHS